MLSIWGDGFTRKWQDVPMPDLKTTWAEGLTGLNEDALRRGYGALLHEKHAPDLPRFIELCRINPAHVAHTFPAITHEHIVTDAGEANLAKIRALLRPLAQRSEVPVNFTGIEWAYRIVRESDTNEKIPLHKLAFANDAITRWCASHHCTRDQLDEHGRWKNGQRYALPATEEELMPALVPSPHIYTGEVREPGEDDE
jgi:hypothetical protein